MSSFSWNRHKWTKRERKPRNSVVSIHVCLCKLKPNSCVMCRFHPDVDSGQVDTGPQSSELLSALCLLTSDSLCQNSPWSVDPCFSSVWMWRGFSLTLLHWTQISSHSFNYTHTHSWAHCSGMCVWLCLQVNAAIWWQLLMFLCFILFYSCFLLHSVCKKLWMTWTNCSSQRQSDSG